MSVGKRLRFEIFKRDGFTCRYCGATPMATVLQIEHVIPKSKGGTDDPVNLVTSCQPCNAGKSNIELGECKLPPTFSAEAIKEHAEQTREYLTAQKAMIAARASVAQEAKEYWENTTGYAMIASDEATMRRFCQSLPFTFIVDAIDITVGKIRLVNPKDGWHAWRYFCGICWRKIKGKAETE